MQNDLAQMYAQAGFGGQTYLDGGGNPLPTTVPPGYFGPNSDWYREVQASLGPGSEWATRGGGGEGAVARPFDPGEVFSRSVATDNIPASGGEDQGRDPGVGVLNNIGATSWAYNPRTGSLMYLDSTGRPIAEHPTRNNDDAFMVAALLAAGVVGGAAAGAGGAAAEAGGEAATAGGAGATSGDFGAAYESGTLASGGTGGTTTAGTAGTQAAANTGGSSAPSSTTSSTTSSASGDLGTRDYINIANGLYGMYQANQIRGASDPFAGNRGYFADRLMELERNPGLITQRPGYQAGVQTINRELASKGYYGGGNNAVGLSRYAGDFYNQEANRLAQLAGAGATPGAGQVAAANLSGQALASIAYGLAPYATNRPQTGGGGGGYYGGGYGQTGYTDPEGRNAGG